LISIHHDDLSATDTEHDESSCGHFCHITFHTVGFVSQIVTPSVIRDAVLYAFFQNKSTKINGLNSPIS
tara:strand:- start:120860 stop:121066 length:207 start_codon:yes stop_codon:yes gene_type:complete